MRKWLLVCALWFVPFCHGQKLRAERLDLYSSCPVGNPPAGTAWACLDLSGNFSCKNSAGSSCLAGAAAGAVLIGPGGDQSVVQPSAGGTVQATSLNSNSFEQIRYADQFQWSQSPSGTISIGANTVTINAIRGIGAPSALPGVFSGYHVTHRIWIAGTGTPEPVTITATSCINASTGTCTVTFTAANSHSAGYTLGTATAGIQEAIVDAYWNGAGNNPVPGYTVKLSPYNNSGKYVIRGTLNFDTTNGAAGGVTLDCESATLEDAVSGAAMITVGGNGQITPEHATIRNCHISLFPGVGRAANGTQVAIWDKGQNLALRNSDFDGIGNGLDVWDTLVQVSNDQGFIMDHVDVASGGVGKCDVTWCGPAIFGDNTNQAAIGTIGNVNFTNVSGFSAAIEWDSGNGLTLRDDIFQNWAKYPWRYSGGLVNMTDQGGNYYEGAASIVNPDFGVAGYSQTTGPQVGIAGSFVEFKPGADRGLNGLGVHRFSNTGGACYSYYIVGHDGIGHQSRPLFVGDACTNGVTNFNVLYLSFGAATYDVLRSGPIAGDGNDAAPWGSTAPLNNWAVATGVVCAANPCTYTETFAAPTPYAVLSESYALSYCPSITYWPVPLFMLGNCTGPSVYNGPFVNGFVNNNPSNGTYNYYDAIFTSSSNGFGAITGMHVNYQIPDGQVVPGASIFNPDVPSVAMTLKKGRVNFPSYNSRGTSGGPQGGITNNLMVQTFDFESNKTLATVLHQPSLNAKDHGIGYDTDASYQMTMCGEHSCDWYCNHLPDSGVSRCLRLSPTGLEIDKGLAQSSGSGYQAIRTVAGCATAASLAAVCTTTVTWTSAFADANYTPHCDGLAITSGVPLNGGITAKVAASVTFQTVSATAAAAQFTNVVCSAFHD